ncbi:hypothetical protein GCM10025864_09500 [Luteimicrobium album]|uniref:Transcriptional regulator LacI/GalR-like sensor domain-containing protein n=1 Tax=Luteimicrobium album TaxID=1054550 RepID=A0ABQ6HYV2_9MICO|nr:hypothetical protein GCM10025864_09500 [Luteimicrobium album]
MGGAAGDRPTAVVCANDLMAIGALDAAFEAGLRVPEDVAIIGIDDIEAASLVRPALTTIRVPAEEIGRTAGRMLQDRIAVGDQTPPRHIVVGHQLVHRQTV